MRFADPVQIRRPEPGPEMAEHLRRGGSHSERRKHLCVDVCRELCELSGMRWASNRIYHLRIIKKSRFYIHSLRSKLYEFGLAAYARRQCPGLSWRRLEWPFRKFD